MFTYLISKKVFRAIAGASAVAISLSGLSALPSEARAKKVTIFRAMSVQADAPWGLDRIDGTLDGSYNYHPSGGSGVRIYIVDTGVDATHPELVGRVLSGYDSFGQNSANSDCSGHGTHIAGVAAGITHGVAKQATIVPVRVLNCTGVGTSNNLIAGLKWITSNHPKGTHGVVNLSLGGSKNVEVNSLIDGLSRAGLSVVAAAGNSGDDACKYSPASAATAIGVGAIDQTDTRATYSNYGQCVDLFAPGSRIRSANALNHFSPTSRTGTSQSAPFVAGAIATYISSGLAVDAPSAESFLYQNAQGGSVINGASSRNSIVRVLVEQSDLPDVEVPSEPDLMLEPVRVVQDGSGSFFGALSWDPVAEASEYRVYKTGTIRPKWRLLSVTKIKTGRVVSDKPGEIAIYRVFALVGGSEILIGDAIYTPQW